MTQAAAGSLTPANLGAVARFLRERGLCDGPLSVSPIGDGHSNLTYAVSDGHRTVVVRCPPPPPAPPGANDVLRESRLMGALRGTAVPVPAVLATARAGEVLDVPCYVMSFVAGPVITAQTPAALSRPGTRREIGESLIDTLAALHAVDWRAAGLGDLGRPEGFNARHLRRMERLIADGGGRLPPHFAPARDWLAARVPPESGHAIVHSDFRIGNVVIAPDVPGRVAAVLDWELATVGDPLLDVGYFLASVPGPEGPLTPVQEFGAAMLEDGYPDRASLAARYARHTGRDLSGLAWYTVMAQWKLAVLYEYSRRRTVRGDGDPYYAGESLVASFLRAADQAAELPVPGQPAQADPRMPQEGPP
jgi:aminoglycoside phosphotransferase (APT) family kinase protein